MPPFVPNSTFCTPFLQPVFNFISCSLFLCPSPPTHLSIFFSATLQFHPLIKSPSLYRIFELMKKSIYHANYPFFYISVDEIAFLEGMTIVYKNSIDLFFYVVGSAQENEVQ
ncbi:hypothetical protein ILYODFUR_037488 [Ilyodon furcidens]|uniref:AP complex mu/sigma subunit domain-containing protein n=1 Tax=Ilyodon furcidens TaxID=33524 RepID=A0ABV0VA86_9TELE